MNAEPQGLRTYDFPEVTVTVPDQHGTWVKVIQKHMPLGIDMSENDAFTPTRLVINLAVVRYEADEKNLQDTDFITSFDPPIRISVAYQFNDLFPPAKSGRTLKLGYWDGHHWVVLSHPSFRFQLLPPSTAPVGEAFISEWAGDPPIGWGK